MAIGPIQLLKEANSAQRSTLIAASLGWMLDAFDAMLYALVLTYVMRDLGMSKAASGFLYTLTLLASGIGGVFFGFLADRIGRKRALMLSILTYSVCSFASGLSTTVLMLAVFRFILGLGMGGEWNTGATLVAETWPDELRAKALSVVQSSWAIGYALAALVAGIVLRYANWRMVLFVGILPAIVTLWIQNRVPESGMWLEHEKQSVAVIGVVFDNSFFAIFRRPYGKSTIALLLLNFFGLFGWWGLFTWIPPYLSLPVSQGGRGLSLVKTTGWLIVMGVGKFLGYTSFGFAADTFGRRKSYVTYLLVAAALVPIYGFASSPALLLFLGPFVAFFGTGHFSGFAAIVSEIFPTEIRATAMGASYNIGRGTSAAAPFVIGLLARYFGLGPSFLLLAGAFLVAGLLALALPETRGKQLE